MNEYLKNLNRIEVVETMACTGRCKHCSEGEHVACKEYLDGVRVAEAIEKVCKNYNIKSLMVFGGEPLLYPEEVCRIFQMAKRVEIPQKEMITNGYFSKDEKRIEAVADMLAESGIDYIMLSVDAFHQETIPVEPVFHFAKCIRERGVRIEVNPAWLVSEEDDNPYNIRTKEILALFKENGFELANGNVIWPEGNARVYLSEYFDLTKEFVNPYEDDPSDVQSISFNPNGDVLNGNVYRDDIMDILTAYQPAD